MPEYLHPGVYIEEIERGPRPIEGVPTSTAAFLGETERGLDHAAAGHQLQGLPALVRRRVRRQQVPAVRGQRLLRERRQARVRLPRRRRRRGDRRRRRSATSSCAPPGPGSGASASCVKISRRHDEEARTATASASALQLGVLERRPVPSGSIRSPTGRCRRAASRGGLRRSRHRRELAGLLRQAAAVHRSRQGRHRTRDRRARRSDSWSATPASPPARARPTACRCCRAAPTIRRRSASTTSRARRRRPHGRAGPRGARARPLPRRRARLRAGSCRHDIAQGDRRALRADAASASRSSTAPKGQNSPSGLQSAQPGHRQQLRRVLLPVDRHRPIRRPARAS